MGWEAGKQQNVNKKNQSLKSLFWLWWHPLTPGFHFFKLNLAVCVQIDTNIYHAHPWQILTSLVHKDVIGKERRQTLTGIRGKNVRNTKSLSPSTVLKERAGEKREDKSWQKKSRIILFLLLWSSLHNFRLAYLISKTLAWMSVDDNLAMKRKSKRAVVPIPTLIPPGWTLSQLQKPSKIPRRMEYTFRGSLTCCSDVIQ